MYREPSLTVGLLTRARLVAISNYKPPHSRFASDSMLHRDTERVDRPVEGRQINLAHAA